MTTEKADIVIIGAGVVGCAVARQCAQDWPEKKIVVLEKNSLAGMESSSHNSGILHSGIHENPRLLKSKLSIRGNKLAADFMKSRELTIQQTGMIIAIPGQETFTNTIRQFFILMKIMIRGLRRRIAFKIVHHGNIMRYEPNLNIAAGILLPNAYIIDPREFTSQLKQEAVDKGVQFYFDSPVTAITPNDNAYTISSPLHQLQAQTVINAAGLYADKVAKMAGFDQYKIHPWRGEYYEVTGTSSTTTRPISSIMPRHHGKGFQLLPGQNGKFYIGPNSYPVTDKQDYTSAITDQREFLKAGQRFLPGLIQDNLKWAYAGMRAKLNETYKESDFIIQRDNSNPTFINLIGIDSPGLTASMAIAEEASKLAK